MKIIPVAFVLCVALSACSGSDSAMVLDTDATNNGGENNNPDVNQGNENTETPDMGDNGATPQNSATYRLTFNATWSLETHPLRWPDNPHFSGLVGAVHNEQVEFWTAGQPATDGVEQMAESGGKDRLLGEVDAAIANGYANLAVSGGGITNSPDMVSVEFEVTRDYPQLTLVSMVAPSPDWFVGVHNLPLVQDGEFVSSLTIDLAVYDAGTDSGTRYTSPDIDTVVRDPISLLTSFPDDSPFNDGQPSVGQFIIEKL